MHGHFRRLQDRICTGACLMLNRTVHVVAWTLLAYCVDGSNVCCGATILLLLLNLVSLMDCGPDAARDRLLLVFGRRRCCAVLLVLRIILIVLPCGRAGLQSTAFLEEMKLGALLEWILIEAVMMWATICIAVSLLSGCHLVIGGVNRMITDYCLREVE